MSITTNGKNSGSKNSNRWSQEQRLEFIDFRLYWEGRMNRSDLTTFFGISVPQASLDIARYLELAPHNLEYNKKLKAYFATPEFKPFLTPPHAHSYLNQLLGVMTHTLPREAAFLGETFQHSGIRSLEFT